jgi:mono/diheme cytochrome c family protein
MRNFIRKIITWLKGKGHVSLALRLLLVLTVIVLILPMAYIALTENIYEFRDTDPLRGAATPKHDKFGDNITSTKYLPQGWREQDSLWFYTVTQGSDLLPYDLFMEVEQPGTTTLFRDNDNINYFGYLPQNATSRNPDGLPVGFVKDKFRAHDYLGFSCAACHTGQVNYNGVGIRIDGGPANSNLDAFVRSLADALAATQNDPAVLARFVQRVRARGNYDTDKEVTDALKATTQQLKIYNTINHSETEYGYARLDAFGRIYNRVLEHVLTAEQLKKSLKGIVADSALDAAFQKVGSPISGTEREHIYQMLSDDQLNQLKTRITNEPNAPVSYPFLWDIPQHDFVQWNGLAANAGLGAVGRNAGEVIGVFGTLDWKKKNWFSISSLISGQGLKTHVSFESSINVHNLRRVEEHLRKLESPQWPAELLPAIDSERLARGEKLFADHCLGCHSEIERADPQRRVVAQMASLDVVRTDPRMAKNSVDYGGWSGILRNEYVSLDIGSMLLDERAPAVGLLTKATLATVATPYPHDFLVQRGVSWVYDLAYALFTNEIKPSLKGGNYNPDTTVAPLASFLSYKARPLNGIWATAPYLHNGSIPNLYALLLPKKPTRDPVPDGEYRPDTFVVGSREFDPVNVGLKSSGYNGFVYDTAIPGNSNAGHEYTSALTKEQRLDLLEYLKSL